MGRVAKGGLLLVAVLLLGVFWEASVLIFAYLMVPSLLRRRGRGGASEGMRLGRRMVAGVFLLVLAAVAVVEGGRLSPLVFGMAGFALLVPGSSSGIAARAKPVPGSMLLRGSVDPFRWSAVGELKVATRDPARALSAVDGRLLLRHSPELRAFCIVEVRALTEGKASARAVEGLRRVARRLAPQGVYVLPLGSAEAAKVCSVPPPVKGRAPLPGDGLGQVSLILEAKAGSVATYRLFAGEGRGGSALVRPTLRPRREVFLAEVMGATFASGHPKTDDLTSFLANAAATAGEAFGERVTEISAEGDGVVVSSPGGARVSLGRAQLRAVMDVYG